MMARISTGHSARSHPDPQDQISSVKENKENADEQSMEDDGKDGCFELASARACIGPKLTKGQIRLLMSMRKILSLPFHAA
jgi:hypothetical protein